MKKIISIVAVLFMLVGCSQSVKQTEDLVIMTSFYPVYDFTQEVAGDKATVKLVMPEGVDAHDYEPSPQVVAAIHDADVFVYHGAGMEPWLESVLSTLNKDKVKTVELSSVVNLIENSEEDHDHEEHDHDDHDGHDHGAFDPHTWLSPKNAIKEVSLIRDVLSEIDSDNKDTYISNTRSYISKLEDLDRDFESLKSLPNHDFLVDHQAYAYLAHDYGLHQKGLMASMLKEEPTPKELENILDTIQTEGIKAFFVDPSNATKLIDVITKETGVKVFPLHTIESLTKEQIAKGDTYLSLMQENFNSLKEGLIRE